jgi:3-hydroxyisobutyrate dehydrogenase-like beta-hydroxyacid dehydrogenase
MTANRLSQPGPNAALSHIHVKTRGSTAPIFPRVAILGTGKMGSAIATRLSTTGFQVVVWNRTRSRAETLGLGPVAATPAVAAAAADIIVSSLTGPEAVLAAYLGPDGALSAGEGKLFIEMSTAGPDLLSTLAERVAAAGGTLVDAPIIGAPPAVRAGEATILAGGFDPDIAVASPVLSAFGTVRHVGSLGSAARLKLVANSMLADVILAAAELQVAGEGSGLDRDDVFWVLERLVPSLEARRAGLIESRHTPPLFALRDLRKDVDLALALFSRSAASTPLTRSASALVNAAAASTPDLDISGIVLPYRQIGHSRPAATDLATTPLARMAAHLGGEMSSAEFAGVVLARNTR